jgi:hypothetical protein
MKTCTNMTALRPAAVANATRHDWASVGRAYSGMPFIASCGLIEPKGNMRQPEVSRF